MLKFFPFLIVFLTLHLSFAQTKKEFKIVDNDNLSIPFSEVISKNAVAISDEDGSVVLEGVSPEDSVSIYAYGYLPKTLTVKEIHHTIVLENDQEVVTLGEAVIESKKLKSKILGVKKKKTYTFGFIQGAGIGAEAIKKIQNNKKIKLKSVSLYVGANPKKEDYTLKLKIYESKQASVSVYEKVITSDVTFNWLTVDLDESVIIEEDFYIAFQWVKDTYGSPLIGLQNKIQLGNTVFEKSDLSGKWIESPDFKWMMQCKVLLLN